MKICHSFLTVAAVSALISSGVDAFSPVLGRSSVTTSSSRIVFGMSTMADSGVPPTTADASSDVADTEIPTNLPSDCGMDYVPLATMLATGQLAEADQVSNENTF
jgi:hypothetical protein